MVSKPPNKLQTKTIKVAGNDILRYYLEKAAETGLFGNNRTAAAAILLGRAIEELIASGIISRAPPEVLKDAQKN